MFTFDIMIILESHFGSLAFHLATSQIMLVCFILKSAHRDPLLKKII